MALTSQSLCQAGLWLISMLSFAAAFAEPTYSPVQAIDHVGGNATVCGVVASAKYASSTRGQPTFLNLDRPYPNNIFTVVIWGSDRGSFTYPPESLAGGKICAAGRIAVYKGKAEIIAHSPDQIHQE